MLRYHFEASLPMPTRAELAAIVGAGSRASMHMMLKNMERKGHIKVGRGWRNIKLVEKSATAVKGSAR